MPRLPYGESLRSLMVLVQYGSPRFIRVEAFHVPELVDGFGAKVFFVNHAILADDEGLDSGDGVLSRSGYQRKASDHYIFHHEVHFAERRVRTLAFKDLEEIAVIGLGDAVALLDRLGNFLADGTSPGAIGILPSQAVLLAGVADDALRKLVHVKAFPWLHGVLILRLHVAVADLNGIKLIGAYATVEELLKSSFAVKEPFVSPLDNRHRKWPILAAYQQECTVPAFRIDGDAFLLAGLCRKIGSVLPVLSEFTTENDTFPTGTKYIAECKHIELFRRLDQRIGGLLRSIKGRDACRRHHGCGRNLLRRGLLRNG